MSEIDEESQVIDLEYSAHEEDPDNDELASLSSMTDVSDYCKYDGEEDQENRNDDDDCDPLLQESIEIALSQSEGKVLPENPPKTSADIGLPPPIRKAFKTALAKTLSTSSTLHSKSEKKDNSVKVNEDCKEYQQDSDKDLDSDTNHDTTDAKDEKINQDPSVKQRKRRLKKYETFERNVGRSLGVKRTLLGGSTVLPSKPFTIPITGGATTRRKSAGLKNIPGIRVPLKPKVNTSAVQELTARPFKVPTFTDLSRRKYGGSGVRPGKSLGMRRAVATMIHALFDANGDKAFVVYIPKKLLSEQEKQVWVATHPGKTPNFEVEVVVDPMIACVLRPHQLEGVQFLYDCTTGLKSPGAFGCIMADEMGLGKTLQCITLLWTLLTQSPIPGTPTIQKAIIACPSSLVKNWANELIKWLGEGRVRPYSCDNKGTKEQTTKDIEQFASCKGRGVVNPVLIISYESLRTYSTILRKTEIGLILCDEGHRLKNADNQTYQALNTLNSKRRVILSGTPIQNDLTEYFSLLSFIIPGVLGTNADFRKKYELPILRGRDADASEDQRKKGEECLAELSAVANKFIIRRTAELLTKYLPTKYEYIVFCKMTEPQIKVYKHFAKLGLKKILSDEEKAERGKSKSTGGQDSLKAMILMKKIVNHPALLVEKDIPPGLLPPDFNFNECQTQYSGKFMLLDGMIRQMKAESTDKIVLISNYTQTLDLIDKLCRTRRWPNFRLDGTMTIAKRQKIVDQFNDPSSPQFIFLLSSKAGGCGINLIGANRLILFDPDWNPANDAQAMARVWRDGQKKTCFLYRLISTGSIEEKIFQRQAHKQSLSSCVVDEEQDVERHFSLDSLRQLFILNETTSCDTHDTFKCKRCQNGKQILRPPNEGIISAGATAADTSTWNHYSHLELQKIHDSVLNKQAKETGMVTYTFQNKSHDSIPKPPKN